ncbi:MAG: phasin family protein [Chloroflexota bacterium]
MAAEAEMVIQNTKEVPVVAEKTVIHGMRQLMLAGVGAVVLTRDETETLVNKLAVRGEETQQEVERVLRVRWGELRENVGSVDGITNAIEEGMGQVLNSLNIPSRRDIDDLNQKITALTVTVEELSKN